MSVTKYFREFLWLVCQQGLQDLPEFMESIRVAEAIGRGIDNSARRLEFFSHATKDLMEGRKIEYLPDDLLWILHRLPITTYGGESTVLWDVLVGRI
jgi:hypothetical protein